jgi:acyl-CoA thioesterase
MEFCADTIRERIFLNFILLNLSMSEKVPLNSKGFHPFGDLIGLKFTKLKKGYSQCTLEVVDKLLNPHKVVHGGVLYSMADTGMGAAAYSNLNKNEICATIEVKINYFKAVKGGTLFCNTKVINQGKKVVTLDSEIFNDDQIVAKALGTYSIIEVNNKKLN